jgi:hypothetical protein
MTKRSPIFILVLTLLTLGLYPYYWLYATSEELRRESGRTDISPLLDAFLAFVTLGAWGVWAGYRNAKLAHELIEESGEPHTDHSIPVAAAGVASFFVGPVAWLVAILLLQDDYNALAEPVDYFEPAPRPRVRVHVPSAEPARSQPAREPARSSNVTVFESNAPAPNVY